MQHRTEPDPTVCPLCGASNACGIAAGASTCWCFETPVPSDVRARIPPEARDRACVCRACAEGRATPVDAGSAAGHASSTAPTTSTIDDRTQGR